MEESCGEERSPPRKVNGGHLVCPSGPKSLVTAALVLLDVGMDVQAAAACSSGTFGCSKIGVSSGKHRVLVEQP